MDENEVLIFRISAGDKEALATLYEKTSAAVYGFALSILRDSHRAEDVMQETYIKVYQAAKGYIPQGKPMAWVLTIVKNLSLMKYREDKKVVKGSELLGAEEGRDATNATLDNLVLQAAMKRLSDQEVQIIVLHSVAGLKHREIAALLQIPLATALSKYHRALAKLKIAIGEDGV